MKNKTITLTLTKLLAQRFSPNNSWFFLFYNKGLNFDIHCNYLTKFIIPAIALPFLPLLGRFIPNQNLKVLTVSLMMSGTLGNYLWRFNPEGVIDFILVGSYSCNLADIFIFVSVLMSFYSIIPYMKSLSPSQPTQS
jgi:lipoprotein signal peptidase